MPRYSFGSKDKKMPKSPGKSKGTPSPPSSTKKKKNKSKKTKTPSHDKSSPRPHVPSGANQKMSARSSTASTSADAKPSARKTAKKTGKDKDAIPSTILKSKRYGIEVPRTARGEDGFADDSPYWKAAREALTQERGSEQSVGGGGGSSSEEDEARKQQQDDQKAAARAKQKERRRKKRMESENVYANFQKDQAALKPNFKVGLQGSDDNDDDEAKSKKNDDGDSSPEWLKETFRELRSQRKRRGESASNRSGVFSPSELSRASTIPPTPKPASPPELDTKQSPAEDHLVDDHDGENFEMENDDYDDGLSPIREEVVVKEATKKSDKLIPQEINEPEDESGEPEELEENIEEVADKLSMDMGINNNNADGDASKSVASKNTSNEYDIDEQPSFNQQDDYSDGGDDEHGGFELNNDPVSSPSPPKRRSLPTRLSQSQDRIETPLLNNADDHSSNSSQSDSSQDTDKRRKKSEQKKKTLTEKETPQQNKPKKKRGRPRKVTINTAFNTGYPAGNREYTTIPATQYEIDQNEDGNARRSRRRKFPPLAYWKNEKVVYESNREEGPMAEVFGDMPMVSGIQQAQPTPYKKREPRRRTYASDEDESNDGKQRSYNMKKADEIIPFDSKKLRKKFNVDDGDTTPVWNDRKEMTLDERIIYYRKDVKLHDLPPRKRKKGDLKVPARAAQTFNVSPDEINAGYIVGCLELPPLGIKADEGVGPCFQIFNVGDCQPKSLELAIADPELDGGNFDPDTAKRFLLSKGDMFHIPPGNIYQVQNHSKTHDCAMTWTIVRPPLRQEV